MDIDRTHPLNAKADPAVAAEIAELTSCNAEVAFEAARIIGMWGSLETAYRAFGAMENPRAEHYAILRYQHALNERAVARQHALAGGPLKAA